MAVNNLTKRQGIFFKNFEIINNYYCLIFLQSFLVDVASFMLKFLFIFLSTRLFGLSSDFKEGVVFSTYATLVSSVQKGTCYFKIIALTLAFLCATASQPLLKLRHA